ncbi:hypothetical protein BJQ90_03799 [Arthrobacter sp. SO3]|nr:hypothetical protein [Arthrobacter sp. SO3]
MTLLEAVSGCVCTYPTFSGGAGRPEYWVVSLAFPLRDTDSMSNRMRTAALGCLCIALISKRVAATHR